MSVALNKLIQQLPVWIGITSITTFFWYYAYKGLTKSRINLPLKYGEFHFIQGKKAHFFGFLFLLAASAMTWILITLVIQELISFY